MLYILNSAVWIWYKVAHKKLTAEITFLVNVLYFLGLLGNIFRRLHIKYFLVPIQKAIHSPLSYLLRI